MTHHQHLTEGDAIALEFHMFDQHMNPRCHFVPSQEQCQETIHCVETMIYASNEQNCHAQFANGFYLLFRGLSMERIDEMHHPVSSPPSLSSSSPSTPHLTDIISPHTLQSLPISEAPFHFISAVFTDVSAAKAFVSDQISVLGSA